MRKSFFGLSKLLKKIAINIDKKACNLYKQGELEADALQTMAMGIECY